MRRAARRDANEDQIVSAMQACGAYVKKVNDEGAYDLLCWYRGHTLLLEVKDGKKPPSAQKLTDAEKKFHNEWTGGRLVVVNSVFMALQELAQPEVANNTGSE